MAASTSSGFIECVICNERLVDPRPLPCGHSFCGPLRLCLISLEAEDGNIRCAICRGDYRLKAEDVKPLYGIRDYLQNDIKQNTGTPATLPCPVHQNKECTFWCSNCEIMMCDDCFDEHDGHLVRKLKKYLVEKIEAELGMPMVETFIKYQESVEKLIDAKISNLETARSAVLYMEMELDSILQQRELVDQFSELRNSEDTNKISKETALLLKISESDVKKLKIWEWRNSLERRRASKVIDKSLVSVSTQVEGLNIQKPVVSSHQTETKSDPTMVVPACHCGYNHKLVPVVDNPITLMAYLHVLGTGPLRFGPFSEIILCPFQFWLETESVSKSGFWWGKLLRITLNCRHMLNKPLVPFNIKYNLRIKNHVDGSKSISREGTWTYPKTEKVFFDTLSYPEVVNKERGWIHETMGVDCISVILKLSR